MGNIFWQGHSERPQLRKPMLWHGRTCGNWALFVHLLPDLKFLPPDLPAFRPVYLSTYLTLYLSTYVYLCTYLSLYLPTYLPTCIPASMPAWLVS